MMYQVAAKYGDRGLVVLGLQVRRDVDVFEENIVYWLQSLRPTFPVFRLGWNPEWPTRTLPWVYLFDHEGRAVFKGHIGRLVPAIEKALDAAPDPVIGGPYVKQKALAETLLSNRDKLGTHLARLRESRDLDPETGAMVAAAERWFERQAARIQEHMPGVVEQAEAWDVLAKQYAGDVLGERAAKAGDALRAAKTYAAEEAAEKALRRARRDFRNCPPRGGYFPYHFTKMNYTVIKDEAWVATRVRMHAELRLALDHVIETWPDTHASEEAMDLLFVHDVPEIPAAAARERVERAERLLGVEGRPAALYEAQLVLFEVLEGYLESDEVARKAEALLASLRKDRAKELELATLEAKTLRAETERLQAEVRRGGSLLSREEAGRIKTELTAIAKRSGDDTVLGRAIGAYVAELEKSFEGKPRVGVGLDPRHRGPGAKIARIYPESGAAKAGLVAGDIVLSLGGEKLAGMADFTKALEGKKPGETVRAEVRRASGEVVTLEVPLGRNTSRR